MGFCVATGGMHSVIHRQQIHHRIRFRGNWRPPKKFNSNNRIVAATKFSAANEISDNMRAAALPVTSLRRSQEKKKKGPSDPHSFSIRNEIGRPADDESRPPMGIAGRQTSISASSLSLLFRRPFVCQFLLSPVHLSAILT